MAIPATAFLSRRTRTVAFQIEFNRNDFVFVLMEWWINEKLAHSNFGPLVLAAIDNNKKYSIHQSFRSDFKNRNPNRLVDQYPVVYSLPFDSMQMRVRSSGQFSVLWFFDIALSDRRCRLFRIWECYIITKLPNLLTASSSAGDAVIDSPCEFIYEHFQLKKPQAIMAANSTGTQHQQTEWVID